MHFVCFKTDAPLSHIQRALDELGRAGFDLFALHVTDAHGGGFSVRIEYCGNATIGPEMYQARLARMPGVWGMEGGTLVQQPLDLAESA